MGIILKPMLRLYKKSYSDGLSRLSSNMRRRAQVEVHLDVHRFSALYCQCQKTEVSEFFPIGIINPIRRIETYALDHLFSVV